MVRTKVFKFVPEIACATLASRPDLVGILQGTIAAAAVINEILAVIAAKKGFELAREIEI